MKKLLGFKVGGLQQKILNLVLLFLIAVIAVYGAVMYYQFHHITNIVNEARNEQTEAVERVSGETMNYIIDGSMKRTNALQAYIADDMFADLSRVVKTLQTIATNLFENQDNMERVRVYTPDPSNNGIYSAQVLFEEGVDYTKSDYLGIVGNMSDEMVAVLNNSDSLTNCFVGLADGTVLVVDTDPVSKLDENGETVPFPVRERPWYTGALNAGTLHFTGIEHDTYTDSIGIECSAPVYYRGMVVGVVGADLFLNSMAEYVNNSNTTGGFVFVVNDEGQIIFAPENSTFKVETADKAEDLRKSDNKELAEFITKALSERTDVVSISVDGKDYYMTGSPMSTIGWTVISAVDKETTELPTKQMLSEIDRINDAAADKYDDGLGNSRTIALIFTALILTLGSCAALFVATKIVRPVEQMTKRITEISGTDQIFEMTKSYHTNDEIEILAEAFAEMSVKTRQYYIDITNITMEKERIGAELELARRIQADMLPNIFPAFPDRPEFDIYATMTPAKEVGGDFYDFFMIDDDHLGMVIADVSGKGVPAALFMMMSKILINNFALLGISPAKVLERTNDTICQKNEEEMFVTAWVGVLEISTGKLTAANAGHEYPVIRNPGGSFELFKDKHGFVIGGMDGIRYRDYEVTIEEGGSLFIYTDGVPEATNAQNELFGTDRLLDALNGCEGKDPQAMLAAVKGAVDEFVGDADQFDDLTMLGFYLCDPGKDKK